MRRTRNYLLIGAILRVFMCTQMYAQSTQFLPEIDAHLKLNSTIRGYFEAKDDRDGGESDQFAIGPSLQLYLKPLLKLKDVAAFDLNDSKTRFLILEAGYRHLTAPDVAPINRLETIVTSNFPTGAGFYISDRNRADLDWKSGSFEWRYRNKLTLQRAFSLGTFHWIPYAAAEPYYTSQYGKWSTTGLYAGALFPAGKHVEFNIYYEHENNTGKRPNQPTNSIGLALYLYFWVAGK